MKKFIISFLSLFLLVKLIHAQPIITETKLLYPSGTSIVKNIESGNSTYAYGSYNIGKELSGAIQKIYRTYFSVDLSTIPTNATIQEVKVNYSTDYKSYTFKLTNISSLGSGLGANWAAIGSGSTLHSGIGYGGGTITSTPVKNQMQSALSSRSMIIGGVGENETANDSYSYLSINIEVRYTRPAASLNFIAQNYMDGGNSGNIGVGINTPTITSRTSPFSFSIYENQTMYFQAYDNQSYNNYNWVFNDSEAPSNPSRWERDHFGDVLNLGQSSSASRPALTSENGSTFQAVLRKLCNLTFSSSGGYVYVNGSKFSSPKEVQVVEQNSVYAVGQWYYSNGIEYSFSHWISDGQSFSSNITASEHKQFNAVYIGKPANSVEYVHFGNQVNQPIVIYWNDNPNPNVTQYQIWRKVKHNGIMGNPVLLATVNRGVGSFTDYDYTLTSSYSDDLLLYDVRAFYSVDNSYSDEEWFSVFGKMSLANMKNENLNLVVNNELPSFYSISNFPNPFNPETTINFQLPENGFVTLKVYDILGKEISTLVNENKTAGFYKVNFNATNLPSGIYIYTISVNGFLQSKKMILTK